LGKGQFSEVLRAKNRLTGKMVALKKIEVSFSEFQRSLFFFINFFSWSQMDLMKNKKAREDCRKEIDLLKQLNHEVSNTFFQIINQNKNTIFQNVIRYYSSFIGLWNTYMDFEFKKAIPPPFSGRPVDQGILDDRVRVG
jgi:serine/threonine protein kinase